jgi:hypothetical protein
MDRAKRELREQKRVLKRKGNQRLRRQIKQTLAEHPDLAPHIEPDLGRFDTSGLNGIDHDTTRRRGRTDRGPTPEDV